MDILLSSGGRLHGGELCWELQRRTQRTAQKDGEGGVAKGQRYEAWSTYRWLSPDLAAAVRMAADMEVRMATSITEALARIDVLTRALERLTSPPVDSEVGLDP